MNLLAAALVILLLLILGVVLYLLAARPYQSADSVANSYDEWTADGILEFYWGEHIHLGHYGAPPDTRTFWQQNLSLCMKWCVGAV